MLQHLSLTPFHLRAGEESGPAGQEWLFIRIDSGFGYWIGPAMPEEILPGSVVVLPPAGHGTLRASQIGDCEGWIFGLRAEALAGLLTLRELEAVNALARSLPNGVRILPASDRAAEKFRALAAEGPAGIGRRIQLVAIVAEVLDAMPVHISGEEPPAVPTAMDRFLRLVHELPESELMSLSPEEWAVRCRCGVRHLNRLFRQQFGTSMREKLTELRLRKARDLLSDADARVESVARLSGYAHAGFFRAAFKRHLGLTPAEWQRKAAKMSKNRRRKTGV